MSDWEVIRRGFETQIRSQDDTCRTRFAESLGLSLEEFDNNHGNLDFQFRTVFEHGLGMMGFKPYLEIIPVWKTTKVTA